LSAEPDTPAPPATIPNQPAAGVDKLRKPRVRSDTGAPCTKQVRAEVAKMTKQQPLPGRITRVQIWSVHWARSDRGSLRDPLELTITEARRIASSLAALSQVRKLVLGEVVEQSRVIEPADVEVGVGDHVVVV
jgi:hypothetical protein